MVSHLKTPVPAGIPSGSILSNTTSITDSVNTMAMDAGEIKKVLFEMEIKATEDSSIERLFGHMADERVGTSDIDNTAKKR